MKLITERYFLISEFSRPVLLIYTTTIFSDYKRPNPNYIRRDIRRSGMSPVEFRFSPLGRLSYFYLALGLSNCRKVIKIYRSGTVNSKSFVGKVFLRIKWKFELTVRFKHEMIGK